MGKHPVVMSPAALDTLLGIPSKDDAMRLRRRLEALSVAPLMGAVYDPAFDSARPPFEVRATYAGHYGIYYTYDEETDTVHVAFIEDSRRDPKGRFSGGGA